MVFFRVPHTLNKKNWQVLDVATLCSDQLGSGKNGPFSDKFCSSWSAARKNMSRLRLVKVVHWAIWCILVIKCVYKVGRWAPTLVWDPYKWPSKWVTGVINLLIGVIQFQLIITDWGPRCINHLQNNYCNLQVLGPAWRRSRDPHASLWLRFKRNLPQKHEHNINYPWELNASKWKSRFWVTQPVTVTVGRGPYPT